MPWYRGVECKSCKRNIALKKLSSPAEGAINVAGSSNWLGAEIVCHYCHSSEFYGPNDLKVFDAKESISGSIVREEFANGITAIRKPTSG